MSAPPDTVVQPSDDGTLIERSWEEPERFAAIFDAYFTEIHRYVARRLDSTAADDLAAETFVVAFRRRTSYDLSRNARPWLYGIATNLIARHRRDERRKFAALQRVDRSGQVTGGHEDRVVAQVNAERIRGPLASAVAALPAGQRDVLLLVVLADLSYDEVAQALDIPFGTVASRLNRARKKLRKALGGVNPLLDEDEDTP